MFKQVVSAFAPLCSQSKKYRKRRNRSGSRKLSFPETLESRRLLAVDPLGLLNDEFDNSANIADWSRLNEVEGWNADQLATWDVNNTQPGRMVLEPHTVVWYQDWRGPMAFKEVTGDFAFTSEVHITDRDDIGDSDLDGVPSDGEFSLGGLMIRTPRNITNPAADWAPGSMQDDGTNNGENYVFLSMGYGNSGEMSFEVKTTRNSNSQLELTPVNSNTATLQVARIGNSIITLLRLPGEEWTVHRRYSRPDMPATLQIGLVAYTNWEKASDFTPFFHNSNVLVPGISPNPTPGEAFTPDLEAGFEYARFATPQLPQSLAGVDLVTAATDQQLLSFLGDNASCEGGCTIDDGTLVQVRLETVDANGDVLSSVTVGESFFLRATVDDLRADGAGVFSAYIDVAYDGDLASPSGALTFGQDYVNAREGSIATPGLIDEAGAVANGDALGGQPAMLFRVRMTANAVGELIFSSNPAELQPEHEVTLYNFNNPVEFAAIDFGSVTINIVDQFGVTNDSFTVNEDTSSNPLDVLANDSVAASVEIVAVGNTNAGGVVSIAANGRSLLYTPAANYFGNEAFTYTVRNAAGETRQAAVTLTVNNVNDNPVALPDAYAIINRRQATSFDVLANDSIAPDTGESLTIASVGTPNRGGSVSIANGQILYTPANNVFGQEMFVYGISDGHGGTAEATVTVTVTKQWHNASHATDVTGDDRTSPLDALIIINVLNGGFSGQLPASPDGAMAELGFLDTNNDGSVSPVDVLIVINSLNDAATARSGAGGEGEGRHVVSNASSPIVRGLDTTESSNFKSEPIANRLTPGVDLEEDRSLFQSTDLEAALADIVEDVLSAWSAA